MAYDATSGKPLWTFPAQTGIIAAPVTYAIDGEQYVTLLAGWGGALPLFAGEVVTQAPRTNVNRVLTFKLGGQASLPPLAVARPPITPPPLTAAKDVLERGKLLDQTYCTQCPGHAVVAGGVVPDLRFSGTLAASEAYRTIVLDGTLGRNGMISFAPYLEPDDVEAIRAYVIEQAHREQKRLVNP